MAALCQAAESDEEEQDGEEEGPEPECDGTEQASVSEPEDTEQRIETWARTVEHGYDEAGHGEGDEDEDEDELFAQEMPFYRFYGDR